jgi:hypothetical protein
MLLLTDKDAQNAAAALELAIGVLTNDRQLDVRQRQETIAAFRDTQRKFDAAVRNLGRDVKRLLKPS